MRRNLFLIIIIFSLIDWSAVLPIYKKKHLKKELAIVRRDGKFDQFMGSNLFDGIRKECFSPEDVNLLIARKEFEIMIPKELPPDLLDDKGVKQILRYFYYGFYMFRRLEDGYSRRVMEKAFYDTLGGFMRYYLVPVSKFSYYASKVELRTVRNVLMLYEKSRIFLNTNGNGWRLPIRNPLTELKAVKIDPLQIPEHKSLEDEKSCSDLDLTTSSNNGMEVVDDYMITSLPKIELEESGNYLSNIWLPFSQKRTYNLRSGKSAFILVKFYRSVSRCYKKKSLPQKRFNRKFREWIIENVKAHLSDDQFYPGLGGILNIYETTLLSDKKELNTEKDKDDYNLGSLNEEDSLNLNEEKTIEKHESNILNEALLNLGDHKKYGDNWFETYNMLDDDEGEIRQLRRVKHEESKPLTTKKMMTQNSDLKTTTQTINQPPNHILVNNQTNKVQPSKHQSVENQTEKYGPVDNQTKKKKCKLKYQIKCKKVPLTTEIITQNSFIETTTQTVHQAGDKSHENQRIIAQRPVSKTPRPIICNQPGDQSQEYQLNGGYPPPRNQFDEDQNGGCQPIENQHDESQPIENQHDESQPIENQPDENEHSENQADENQNSENQPYEFQSDECQLPENRPDEIQTDICQHPENQPDENQTGGGEPLENHPCDLQTDEYQPSDNQSNEDQIDGYQTEICQPPESQPKQNQANECQQPDSTPKENQAVEHQSPGSQSNDIKANEFRPAEKQSKENQADEGQSLKNQTGTGKSSNSQSLEKPADTNRTGVKKKKCKLAYRIKYKKFKPESTTTTQKPDLETVTFTPWDGPGNQSTWNQISWNQTYNAQPAGNQIAASQASGNQKAGSLSSEKKSTINKTVESQTSDNQSAWNKNGGQSLKKPSAKNKTGHGKVKNKIKSMAAPTPKSIVQITQNLETSPWNVKTMLQSLYTLIGLAVILLTAFCFLFCKLCPGLICCKKNNENRKELLLTPGPFSVPPAAPVRPKDKTTSSRKTANKKADKKSNKKTDKKAEKNAYKKTDIKSAKEVDKIIERQQKIKENEERQAKKNAEKEEKRAQREAEKKEKKARADAKKEEKKAKAGEKKSKKSKDEKSKTEDKKKAQEKEIKESKKEVKKEQKPKTEEKSENKLKKIKELKKEAKEILKIKTVKHEKKSQTLAQQRRSRSPCTQRDVRTRGRVGETDRRTRHTQRTQSRSRSRSRW